MIEIKNATVGYGKQTVFDGVNVAFEKGKITCIIGINGCGKSTLLKAILGILPLSAGETSVDGQVVGLMGRNEVAKKIAYLPQGKSTPDMTVSQMVLHGRFPYLSYPSRYSEKDKAVAYAAMERVGIHRLAHKPLHCLSGGMRQNAYIAMALAQETDYILLDEPTTYLDIAHQLELMGILRELASEGKGVIAVMHDLPLAFDFSDEIALIKGKDLIVKATPAEMSDSPAIKDAFGVCIKYEPEAQQYYYAT